MSNVTQKMQQALSQAEAIASNKAALLQRNKEQAAVLLRLIQVQLAQRPMK